MSEQNTNTYIGDVLTKDTLATIAALESKVETQRAEIVRLNSVVDQVADVKECARSCISQLTERNAEKEELQVQLEGVRREMEEKVARANGEIVRREKDLREKDETFARLQEEQAALLDRVEESRKDPSSSSDETPNGLKSQLAQLKEEYAAAQDKSLKTINKLNNGIKVMAQQIAKENKLREDASRKESELEGRIDELKEEIDVAEKKAEIAMQYKDGEAEQLNAQVEQYRAAAQNEAEKSKESQSEIEQLTNELTNERQLRGKALRGKSELEGKIFELQRELDDAKKNAEVDVQEKDGELQRLDTQIESEAEANRKLQAELESMSNEIVAERKTRDEALRVQSQQEQRIEQLDCAHKSAEMVVLEMDEQLQKLNAQVEEFRAMSGHESEINKVLRSELERANGEVVDEQKRRDELERKIARLSGDMGVAEKNTESAMQKKDMELQQLSVQVEEYKAAVDSSELANESNVEAKVRSELKSKIARLSKEKKEVESSMQSMNMEVQELNDQVEESKATLDKEAEQKRKLQSDLDRLTREVAEECRLRSAALEGKSNFEAKLVELSRELDAAKSSTERALEDKDRELHQLSARVDEYKVASENEAETNRKLQSELERSSSELKAKSMQARSELENKIADAEKKAVAAMDEKEQELQQLRSQVEECKAAIEDEDQTNQRLQSELTVVMSEVVEARQMKGDALRGKSELESKVAELNQEIAAAKSSAETLLQEKIQELQQLNAQVEECEATTEKDIEMKRKLQSELDQVRLELADSLTQANAKEGMLVELLAKCDNLKDQEKTINTQKEELSSRRQMESTIEQLETDLDNAQDKSRATINRLNNGIQAMAQEIAKAGKSVDEALQGKTDLEDKVAQLNEEMAIAEKSADTAMQEKNRELEQLSAQLDEYKAASDHGAEVSRKLQSELDRSRKEMADSLAQANDEIIQYNQDLNLKEETLADLQDNHDNLLHDQESSKMIAKKTISDQAEALRSMEASRSQLNSQTDKLNKDLDTAQETIDILNNGVQVMVQEITKEKSLLNGALQEKSELQEKIAEMHLEIIATRTNEMVTQQLSAQVEDRKSAVENEKEKNRKLRSELELVTTELGVLSNRATFRLSVSLGDLAELWRQRMSGLDRGKGGIVFESEYATTESDSAAAQDDNAHNAHGNEGVIPSLPQSIDHSSEAGSHSAANGSSPRQTSGRRENLFSRFRSSGNSSELDAMCERDRLVNELKAIVYCNIKIIMHLKHTVDEMESTEEGKQSDMASSFVMLKESLASLGADVGWGSTKFSSLQATVKDLESTVSLLRKQNGTLKEELNRVQCIMNDIESQSSYQEDDVEALKAKVLCLELKVQMQEDEKKSIEEDLNEKLECRDMTISTLRMSEMKDGSSSPESNLDA